MYTVEELAKYLDDHIEGNKSIGVESGIGCPFLREPVIQERCIDICGIIFPTMKITGRCPCEVLTKKYVVAKSRRLAKQYKKEVIQ